MFPSSETLRIFAGFWLLGLINNVLYVIILSAALDLVGPSIPKGVVLLADVLPSFLVKLTAPYYIHVVPYSTRVLIFVLLSAGGMLIIALSPDSQEGGAVVLKLLGVAMASLSSGGGELSFLGLTHFYGEGSLGISAWSSGTGGAGLVGAGAYVLATTTFGLSSRTTLLAFAFLPLIMLVSFFVVLPPRLMARAASPPRSRGRYQTLPADEPLLANDANDHDAHEGSPPRSPTDKGAMSHGMPEAWQSFKTNLHRARGLFFPYMLPLLLVYIAEYTINQGVTPTLLFPLRSTPFFKSHRDFYPTYNFIYQLGVFVSRSSILIPVYGPRLRIHRLYVPSLLQILTLVLLIAQSLSLNTLLPSVWLVFAVIFWEGLLGGAVYVNTFAEISEKVEKGEREFSLSATTASDSGGICVAALLSMGIESALCEWQVKRGVGWCRGLD